MHHISGISRRNPRRADAYADLSPEDRQLVLDQLRAGVQALSGIITLKSEKAPEGPDEEET